VDQARLLQAAGELVRRLNADVGARAHCALGQVGMEAQVPAPRLVDDDHRVVRRSVHGADDRARVGREALIGRGRVEDGERLRISREGIEHAIGARRQHGLEARLVGRGQEAEVQPEGLDRVDDRVVDVARHEHERVAALEGERLPRAPGRAGSTACTNGGSASRAR
jgi:hypothetical protein